MLCDVVLVDGEKLVLVAVGVVTPGADHGLLCSLNSQMTEIPLQTPFTSLPAMRTRLHSTYPFNKKNNSKIIIIKEIIKCNKE